MNNHKKVPQIFTKDHSQYCHTIYKYIYTVDYYVNFILILWNKKKTDIYVVTVIQLRWIYLALLIKQE